MKALLLLFVLAQIGKPPELNPEPTGPEVAEGAFELRGVDPEKGAQLIEALGSALHGAGLRYQTKAMLKETVDAGTKPPSITLQGSLVCARDGCTLAARTVGKGGKVHSQQKVSVQAVDGLFTRVAPVAQALARQLEASLRPPDPKKSSKPGKALKPRTQEGSP